MPPKYVKTIQHQIFYQYAKIIARAAIKGSDESFYRKMVTSTWKQLCSGEINWSTSTREWIRERDEPNKCIYCGQEKELTVEHILPKCCGGEDESYNTIMVCKSCNSSKGGKRLYEWKEFDANDKHHSIAEGKYLKYLYHRHERQGALDCTATEVCPKCNLRPKCEAEDSVEKISVYCIEGCFHK